LVILILIFFSINSFAESKKDPLWEKKVNAQVIWQEDLSRLLISKAPNLKELIEIHRDLLLTRIEIQTALYYYFLEYDPNRIQRIEGQYYTFGWSDEDEEKLIKWNNAYKQLINRKNKLKEKNKNHPMWLELKRVFTEIKNDSQYQKLHRQLMDTLKEIDKSLGPAQKTSFAKDEYGSLYWESEKGWKYNWLFKTKTNFKSIEIVIIDRNGNQDILVDNETMNHSPFWFEFRLNEPKLIGSKTSPTLSIPFGYSRSGYKPKGESSWAHIKGNKVIETTYNRNPSFDESGRMVIIEVKTSDDTQEFKYTILLKYQKDK